MAGGLPNDYPATLTFVNCYFDDFVSRVLMDARLRTSGCLVGSNIPAIHPASSAGSTVVATDTVTDKFDLDSGPLFVILCVAV
jgi:hypothetical protein